MHSWRLVATPQFGLLTWLCCCVRQQPRFSLTGLAHSSCRSLCNLPQCFDQPPCIRSAPTTRYLRIANNTLPPNRYFLTHSGRVQPPPPRRPHGRRAPAAVWRQQLCRHSTRGAAGPAHPPARQTATLQLQLQRLPQARVSLRPRPLAAHLQCLQAGSLPSRQCLPGQASHLVRLQQVRRLPRHFGRPSRDLTSAPIHGRQCTMINNVTNTSPSPPTTAPSMAAWSASTGCAACARKARPASSCTSTTCAACPNATTTRAT